MVDRAVVKTVRRYLRVLREHGIPAKFAVIYGSHARGTAGPDSDIDLLVVSAAFESLSWSRVAELWRLTLKADPRIEPIPVGERQFREDGGHPLIEHARREGVKVRAAAPTSPRSTGRRRR